MKVCLNSEFFRTGAARSLDISALSNSLRRKVNNKKGKLKTELVDLLKKGKRKTNKKKDLDFIKVVGGKT